MRTTVMVIVGVLVAASLGGCTSTANTPAKPDPNTATASGKGTVSAAPDQAMMTFGVQSQAKNAKLALNSVSAKAAKINAALKRTGVAEKDLQTANVSIYPDYRDTKSGKPQIVGYQASLSVSAKVRDLAALSDVIQAGTAAGATEVNGPMFSIADDSPIQAQAIQQAVDNARRVAEAMAKASGKKLGPVLSVTSVPVPDAGLYAAKGFVNAPMAADGAVPLQTGQLDVSSNVTVTFELR
jgi:uncharacterized protein YggE